MANQPRGEIAFDIGGRRHVACLTLGALAELETAFGAGDLVALAERLAQGRLSANDLVKIVGAGLRGAGEAIGDADVAALRHPEGAPGFARLAAALVAAAFGEAPPPNPPLPRSD